jgi:hypothetical protein
VKNSLESRKIKCTNSAVERNMLNTGSLQTLTLHEAGNRINTKDLESIKRWLLKNNICIYKLTKQNCVYEIDVDCAIDKIRVRDLRNQYPNDWEKLYKKIARDNSVYEMVVYSLGGEVSSKPTTTVKPESKYENELIKKYRT